jgi:hypothetical protein
MKTNEEQGCGATALPRRLARAGQGRSLQRVLSRRRAVSMHPLEGA